MAKTAGYSGTPLPKKLGIQDEHRVLLLHSPHGFETTLGRLRGGVEVRHDLRGRSPFDVVVLFCAKQSVLRKDFPRAAQRLETAGGLWVAWPKKASGVATDVTEGVVREFGLSTGLVDNKICAVDETWSGLRFVIRVKDR